MEKQCVAIECHCTNFNRHLCKHYRIVKEKKSGGFKRSSLKPKVKPTGELEFMKREWDKRGGQCFVTGQTIREFSPLISFHILSKGAFPDYRLKSENLIFVNAQYHLDWHSLGQKKCLEKDQRWQKVIALYDQLKNQYEYEHRVHE